MVPHHKVQDVLNRGHIFINTSIAEAFCIAVLEAVACGLKVVTTNVGGIPEILPKDMMLLCEPDSKSLVEQLDIAMQTYKNFSPSEFNKRIAKYYSWRDVAERTETQYKSVLNSERCTRAYLMWTHITQNWTHPIYLFGFFVNMLMCFIMNFFWPSENYETAIDLNIPAYSNSPDSFGDHDFKVTDPKKLDNQFFK